MHHPIITSILLAIAVSLAVICSIGVAVMRDAFQRLHFSSPITVISVWLIVIAVWLEDTDWQARIKAALVALILFLMNAVLSHATARAIRIREAGHWDVHPDENIPLVKDKGIAGQAPDAKGDAP